MLGEVSLLPLRETKVVKDMPITDDPEGEDFNGNAD